MLISWHESAWADYLWWQTQDRKTLRRINAMIKAIQRNGYEAPGSSSHCVVIWLDGGACALTVSIGWCLPFATKCFRSTNAAGTTSEAAGWLFRWPTDSLP